MILEKISQITTLEFFFNPTPDPVSVFYLPLGILFGVLVILSVVIALFAKGDYRRMFKPYIMPFSISGIAGLIHLGSRYETLPWLASRFFLVMVFTVFIAWLLGIAIWMAGQVPQWRAEKIAKDKFDRYLPKNKRSQTK